MRVLREEPIRVLPQKREQQGKSLESRSPQNSGASFSRFESCRWRLIAVWISASPIAAVAGSFLVCEVQLIIARAPWGLRVRRVRCACEGLALESGPSRLVSVIAEDSPGTRPCAPATCRERKYHPGHRRSTSQDRASRCINIQVLRCWGFHLKLLFSCRIKTPLQEVITFTKER